jgi:hypothetical protein
MINLKFNDNFYSPVGKDVVKSRNLKVYLFIFYFNKGRLTVSDLKKKMKMSFQAFLIRQISL